MVRSPKKDRRDMMKKKIKIIIITVLIVAVVAGGIGGAVYYKSSSGTAEVQSVSMISTTNDYTSMTSEGIVCDDASQTIYLQDGQKVTDVFVTKGQQVKAGDKLMAYDVTSLSLSVEMKKLEISSYENQLATEKEKLAKLKNTKPVAKQPETPVTPEPEPQPEPDSQPQEQHDVMTDMSGATGSGTADDPYIISCNEDSYVSGALLNKLMNDGLVAKFIVGDAEDPDMALTIKGDSLAGYDDNDEVRLFLGSTAADTDDTQTPDTSEPVTEPAVDDSAIADDTQTYTADELKAAVRSRQEVLLQLILRREWQRQILRSFSHSSMMVSCMQRKTVLLRQYPIHRIHHRMEVRFYSFQVQRDFISQEPLQSLILIL